MYEILHLENPLPEKFPPFCRDGFLFLQARHLLNQSCRPLHYFALVDSETGRADARFALFIRDDWAVSPCAASFGSVEFSEDLPDEELRRFVGEVITYSKKLPVQGLRIVNYPNCYLPTDSERLHAILLDTGFAVKYEELNQHLIVSIRSFTEQLHNAERRRLRKCQQAGFTTRVWTNPDVDELFGLVRKARLRKNLPLSMNSKELANLVSNFKSDCPVFTVWNGDLLIAACLGIRVTEDILYYFLPADHEDYQNFSPSVMLVESLYSYCQFERISLLDLGISTSQAVRNEGLIQFKKRLGAVESPKFVFEMRF
ncbi:GNAT family N-acetyltransferase [Larkinella terrae]|uniref:GNAT family N-acetyltransferase n=1 Tax=Larkinella terrae TaxID=2025311 RepID=UPI00147962B6|nr:GNAT family N-acetyltransferase [Larkinella terrae]